MKNFERFLKGEIIYIFPTKELFVEFNRICESKGISALTDLHWDTFRENSCFRYDSNLKRCLFERMLYYRPNAKYLGINIIEFTTEIEPTEIEPIETLKDNVSNHSIVKLRNGNICCLMDYKNYGLELYTREDIWKNNGVSSFYKYRDNLTHPNKNHDIVAYKNFDSQSRVVGIIMSSSTNYEDAIWDWERKEPKQLTKVELEKILGYEFEIVETKK